VGRDNAILSELTEVRKIACLHLAVQVPAVLAQAGTGENAAHRVLFQLAAKAFASLVNLSSIIFTDREITPWQTDPFCHKCSKDVQAGFEWIIGVQVQNRLRKFHRSGQHWQASPHCMEMVSNSQ
jgi:hypothetical protein